MSLAVIFRASEKFVSRMNDRSRLHYRIYNERQCARPEAHRLCAGSRAAPRVLPTRYADVRRAVYNIADDELFGRAMRLSNHVLHALPPQSSASQRYNLRHHTHSLQLPSHTTFLSDSNFITRMLYIDKY